MTTTLRTVVKFVLILLSIMFLVSLLTEGLAFSTNHIRLAVPIFLLVQSLNYENLKNKKR